MPHLYRNISLRENPQTFKKNFVNVIYPDIILGPDDTYLTTTVGDRLDLLADTYYGDVQLWWVIANANPGVIRRDSYNIPPGKEITIPQNLDIIYKNLELRNQNR